MACTVAVVGAGVGGVTAVKWALHEGFQVTCYEQDDNIGGTWYYSDHVKPGQRAGVYEDLISNDSKEIMSFSDFPMKNEYGQHIRWQDYLQYLRDYAHHFDVTRHVQFNTTVTKVTPAPDYEVTGRWDVHTRKKGTDKLTMSTFDKVMVATGPLGRPLMPNLPGLEKFQGEVIHCQQFRKKNILDGKRVVVYGDGLFGSEVTSLAGQRAKQTYAALKEGHLLVPRSMGKEQVPYAALITRHLMLDLEWENVLVGVNQIGNGYVDHDKYDLNPKHPMSLGGRAACADHMDELYESGRVIGKRGIRRVTERGVVFGDGTEATDIDLIVCATGFGPDVDLVDIPRYKGLKLRQDFDLYLWSIPVHLPHPSLVFIDFGFTFAAFSQSSELQSRIAVRLFSGKHSLPSQEKMLGWLEEKRQYFQEKTQGKFMVLFIRYLDELAEELGVAPTYWRLFWIDPFLAHRVHYGLNLPVIYRMLGPDVMKNAKKYYNERYIQSYTGCVGAPPIPWGLPHFLSAALVLTGIATAAVAPSLISWFTG